MNPPPGHGSRPPGPADAFGSRNAVQRPRRAYLDWLRGIAVLLMIEAHLLDSWTRTPDRESQAFMHAMIVGGMGTALFLLLAGVAVALSSGAKWRRSGDRASAAAAVMRRGLEVFALAFLFRLQAWILGWSGNPYDLLKVDILNIMGPSIVFGALLWRAGGTVLVRGGIFAAAAVITAFATPLIRMAPLSFLPDPLEAYIVPVAGLSNFVFFPWMGLVFVGGFIGVLIDGIRSDEQERRVNVWLGVAGAGIAAAAYAASYLPSPYTRSHFWTSSPAYFFIRAGLALLLVAAAFAWNALLVRGRWSPINQLGTTSLFIYWIHVEMVYGLISRPLHKSLSLPEAAVAFVLFTALMLVCSLAKERLVGRGRLGVLAGRGPR